MRFKNKTAVVTGGANGIGRCIVEAFVKEGARTAVIDLAPPVVECDLYYQGDIAYEITLKEFSKNVIEAFGNIDYLINNACIGKKGILSGCSFDDFVYVQKVGVVAPYMLSMLFMDNFGEEASIVNIASTRAFMSQADTESYSAAKGGILSLTHSLAVSLSGIARVNCISPGWINNEKTVYPENDKSQHPACRIGIPEDISNAVLFLCSKDAGFITGQNLTVDGGMTRLMIYNDDGGWSYEKAREK